MHSAGDTHFTVHFYHRPFRYALVSASLKYFLAGPRNWNVILFGWITRRKCGRRKILCLGAVKILSGKCTFQERGEANFYSVPIQAACKIESRLSDCGLFTTRREFRSSFLRRGVIRPRWSGELFPCSLSLELNSNKWREESLFKMIRPHRRSRDQKRRARSMRW